MRPPHRLSLAVAILACIWLAEPPAQATWVGINVDIHQDVPSPWLPNDFHLVALVCSTSDALPQVLQTVNGRPGSPVQFPYVDVQITPAPEAGPCWFWLHVNWFYPPGTSYIAYCQVIHLGILLDVPGENVLIDAYGYWSRDGTPVGLMSPSLRNKGFVPIIGFDVPETGGDPRMRIVNGRPTWLPPPPLPIMPPPQIPLSLRQIDMIAFPPGAAPPFTELWTGGQQMSWPWVYVVDPNGARITDTNPLTFVPDSFFDVFLEVPMPPIPPGALRTITPVVVESGGFLVSRQRVNYTGNNNNSEVNRWVWEVHGAQPAQACCFSNGSCLDLIPAVCTQQGGTPQGPGTTCANVICLGPPACCFPDGSCLEMSMMLCQDAGGMFYGFVGCNPNPCPQPGACCFGTTCTVMLGADCVAQGGVFKGVGTDCFPNPCVLAVDYWLNVQGGTVVEQGGTGYMSEWFLYPNNWWNQWWPNEFALDRQKRVTLTFTIDFPPTAVPPVVAFNYASQNWSNPNQPPLPPDNSFVVRVPVDPPITVGGTYTRTVLLPFCPRWVSVDVQGSNFTIQGTIQHVCLAPATGACCVGWTCSVQTQQACANMHGRYLGDGTTCGPPNPCEIRDVVKCEPQPPNHPTHYWYDVTPGNFGRCDFHVRVYDTVAANYTNILKPAATWQFAVHQLPNGEWWASWWDPNCQNAIFQTFRFGFDNAHLSTWNGWTTTIGANNDPYDWQIDNWTHHANEPDGLGYRVHVPSDQLPLGACCYGLVGTLCLVTAEAQCTGLGGTWHYGFDCTDADGDGVADICEPPLGACCFADGTCLELWQHQCMAQGGILWLQGVPCDPIPCPPSNDNCPAQIPVGDVIGLAFDTTNATLDGPNHCQLTKNIWYCYIAPCTGWARIDTCGSSFDTKLAVYHDCYCYPSLPMMMCCDDNGCGLQSVCYIPVTAGHGFLIEIGGAPASLGGSGVLNIQCFPSGACCFGPNYLACQVTTQPDCVNLLGGVWHEGANCADLDGDGVAEVCEPPMGACCFTNGACVEMWHFQCMDAGGTLWLEGAPCLPENPCPQPPDGACCWGPDYLRCIVTSEWMCQLEFLGIWHGPGTTCDDLNGDGIADICEPSAGPEACCLPGGVCLMIPRPECYVIEGYPLGAGTVCLGDLNGDGMDDICDLKWLQPPELRVIGLDVNASVPFDLADDWRCEREAVLTEFLIWGSWFQDMLPGDPMNVLFWLTVHADIPDPDGDGPLYSMPGPILWVHPFPPGSFEAMPYQPALEGWLTPPDEFIFPGDTMCWLYRFKVPQWEGFWQGHAPAGDVVVYWLEVQAQVMGGPQPATFGWKTTWKHWNDDAVWALGPGPGMGPWQELRYPPPHLLFPRSIDLAFGMHELRICRGDVDCSGVVDFFDIDPFVYALQFGGGVGYPFPHCPWLNADCDGDGDVDFFDIDPFVALLGSHCPP